MTDEKKSGSLGFFSSYDDLSDSSSDSDEERDGRKKKAGNEAQDSGSEQAAKRTAGGAALPKPDELFRSVSKPTFLYNPLNKEIDWDSLTVKPPEEPAKEFKPWKTNAVPPPESYVAEPERKKGPPPGMDMAIKWSNVYEDNGEDAPNAYSGKARFLPAEEQPSDSDEESQTPSISAKKRRVETFQQKEKRKRDLGQATSDKNFVEEEKRILRQKAE
ncbi:UPF0690 protein C1orf52 homolog [Cyprinodon tularosa]|uniref:Chromosome 1 open reading frame 52 n=1 Tax=Cyprinodon variegatus TaxID=28743 RepID=A0A3Q2DR36_CYPVA|nr:PREDICTED: UPF0690 protein C1orf52 homolog [Cyprinodon variegatus]XP_038151025.1 UPF0690 protein C1orf52 homolog [Cyprinodon tularosa]